MLDEQNQYPYRKPQAPDYTPSNKTRLERLLEHVELPLAMAVKKFIEADDQVAALEQQTVKHYSQFPNVYIMEQ